MSRTSTATVLDPPRLTGPAGRKLARAGQVALALGAVLAIAAAAVDLRRFAFSWLTGFLFVVTLSLGALFFVLVQHLTRAGWSVGPRRQMEWIASALPVLALLFLPVAALSETLFHAWMGDHGAAAHGEALTGHAAVLHGKAPYLNPTFFFIRAAIYFAVWIALSRFFDRLSRAQDGGGDPELTRRMQRMAAPATLLFGLTITFAAFDWVMSLDPMWYSTIFGVYLFAGAVTSSLAALALIVLALNRAGLVRSVIGVEHRHDIGKLLFGFTVFYGYIAFSQYFLIWYANIPEETSFYLHRWVGSWQGWSLALIFGQFVIPFVLLLSRAGKRNGWTLGAAAAVLLVSHYVDLFWLVMPHLHAEGARFGWIELAGLLGPLGAVAFWVARRFARDAMYPTGDPRLGEAVRLENA